MLLLISIRRWKQWSPSQCSSGFTHSRVMFNLAVVLRKLLKMYLYEVCRAVVRRRRTTLVNLLSRPPPPSAGATRWRPSYCRAATSGCSTMTTCRPIGTRRPIVAVAAPIPRGGTRRRPWRHSPCIGSSGEGRGVVIMLPPTRVNVA